MRKAGKQKGNNGGSEEGIFHQAIKISSINSRKPLKYEIT
jgi:hypothetical protein